MWKQHNFINKESNQAQESADTMLANLISRKLLTEDEIDRDQELITIKKKDGTVITEISYGNVTINISKTPATEKSGVVVLTVTATGTIIPNIDLSNGNEEFNNWRNTLSEEEKKEIIKYAYIKAINMEDKNANCKTFQDALDWLKNYNGIEEATETAFWNMVESDGGIDEAMKMMEVLVNKDTKMLEGYIVTNPANETSNEYIATENGIYTFKIQDIVTGKIYTKKVEVTNVDTSLPSLTVVGEKDKNEVLIKLKIATADKYTKFEKAYIMYNNEKIDVTSEITGNTHILAFDIALSLEKSGKIDDKYVLENTDQTIILVKDNKEYTGTINMGEFPRLQ